LLIHVVLDILFAGMYVVDGFALEIIYKYL